MPWNYRGTTEELRVDNSDLETINVRLPEEVIRVLDQLVEKGVFANRSEAIREFCREYVLEAKR
jgi:metal-responsive CopG/Arc/MetJ family transcriptional regulator